VNNQALTGSNLIIPSILHPANVILNGGISSPASNNQQQASLQKSINLNNYQQTTNNINSQTQILNNHISNANNPADTSLHQQQHQQQHQHQQQQQHHQHHQQRQQFHLQQQQQIQQQQHQHHSHMQPDQQSLNLQLNSFNPMTVAAAAELVSSLIKVNPQQEQLQQQQQSGSISNNQLSDQNLLSYSHLENLIEESSKSQTLQSSGLLNGQGGGAVMSKQQTMVGVGGTNSLNGESYAKDQSQLEQQQIEEEKDAKSKFSPDLLIVCLIMILNISLNISAKVYTCARCPEIFNSSNLLRKHVSENHEKGFALYNIW